MIMNKIKIAEKILSHYRAAVNPQMSHYYGIIASMGLVGMAEADNKYLPLLHEVLDAFPDSIRHPRYNFPSYRVGGIAKARAIYDGFIKDRDAELLTYAEELMTAKRSQDGIISMPYDGGEKKIWIDVATAATPFLLFAGLHFDEKKYINEAVFQTLGMYDIFLDESCGLLHQSRGFCGENRISEDHWSRGNGWGIYPLSILCEFLPDDHPEKPRCREYFMSHMNALASASVSTITPAYYDVTLQRKHTRDDESKEMLDIIFNSRIFDVVYAYNWGGVRSIANNLTADSNTIASSIASLKTASATALEKYISDLE